MRWWELAVITGVIMRPTKKGIIVKNIWKTTTIILACMYAYDTYIALYNKKQFKNLKESWHKLDELNDYLVDVIEREEVEVTQFDNIAIRAIIED